MVNLTSEQQRHLYKKLVEDKHDSEMHLAMNEYFGMTQNMLQQMIGQSTNDNHPGDLATELYEREKDIALNEQMEAHLNDIDAALQRMNDESYGFCEICGDSIPYERLMAKPTATRCIQHCKQSLDTALPFGRSMLDEINDLLNTHQANSDDANFAWDIVEAWGTSNTPAMADNANMDHYNDPLTADDEHDGYVQLIEGFVVTDITGKWISVIRNKSYRAYMANDEGEHDLEVETDEK